MDPNDWSQHYFLGLGYEATGNLREAISEYEKALQLSDGAQRPAVALAHAFSAAGEKAKADRILRDLERKSKEISVPPYTMATLYADGLRPDPRFQTLLRRLGLTS